MHPTLLSLVDAAAPPIDHASKRAAVQLLSTVTLATVIAILGIGLIAMMLVRRHRRKLLGIERSRRLRRPPPDPWFESARRVPRPDDGPKSRIFTLPGPGDDLAGADDDTVDIDPDELGEHDVEGDEPDEPAGPGRPPSRRR